MALGDRLKLPRWGWRLLAALVIAMFALVASSAFGVWQYRHEQAKRAGKATVQVFGALPIVHDNLGREWLVGSEFKTSAASSTDFARLHSP